MVDILIVWTKTDLFMILQTHMATRRQVWMFAKLYESVQTEQKWLDIARSGVKFLRKHAKTEGHRVYFATDRQGRGNKFNERYFQSVSM